MNTNFEIGDWVKAEFETNIPIKRGTRETFMLNQLDDDYFEKNPGVRRPKVESTKTIRVHGYIISFFEDMALVQCRSKIDHVPVNQLKEADRATWANEARKGGR